VTLLLDTHALLWFLQDNPQLSSTAKTAIEDPASRKLVSVASCWEIAIKAGIGKLKLGETSADLLTRELARNCFELLPISLANATAVELLPPHHKDPFDRMIVVQAIANNIPIVSQDSQLNHYGVKRIW